MTALMTAVMTTPLINLLLYNFHGPLDTRYRKTKLKHSQLQDTRHNWTSQNTQPLKREILHVTVQHIDNAPKCSKLWDPIIPKITRTIKPDLLASPSLVCKINLCSRAPLGQARATIRYFVYKSFPKNLFYCFSIFNFLLYYFCKICQESIASLQITDTTHTDHLPDCHLHHSTLHIPSLVVYI